MNILETHDWHAAVDAHLAKAKKPLIAVIGPTASGKTGLSLEIAQYLGNAEIVNADSRQLYRGLDIGTAKIRSEEMRGIPHHLFSVLDPEQDVTIAWYQKAATNVIEEIRARCHVPILVGGSMLYLSSVIDGLEPLPVADPEIRRRLEQEYDLDKGETLYQKLQEVDPDSALTIHPHNKPYVVRAMEIYESTGKPASLQKKATKSDEDVLLLGLEWPRETIVQRIEERTPKLLEGGWVEEVAELLKRGYTLETPAMKSHGYREIASAIQTGASLEDIRHDPALIEAINRVTRQYAKRQMTWWKHDPRIIWGCTATGGEGVSGQ